MTYVSGVVATNPEAASVTVKDNEGVVSFVRVPSAASDDVTVMVGSVSSIIAVAVAIDVLLSVVSVQEVPQP